MHIKTTVLLKVLALSCIIDLILFRILILLSK